MVVNPRRDNPEEDRALNTQSLFIAHNGHWIIAPTDVEVARCLALDEGKKKPWSRQPCKLNSVATPRGRWFYIIIPRTHVDGARRIIENTGARLKMSINLRQAALSLFFFFLFLSLSSTGLPTSRVRFMSFVRRVRCWRRIDRAQNTVKAHANARDSYVSHYTRFRVKIRIRYIDFFVS